MPLYEYCCKTCNHVFSQSKKMVDSEVPCGEPCPECGASSIEKLIDAPPLLYTVSNLKPSKSFQSRLKQIGKTHGVTRMGNHADNITEI